MDKELAVKSARVNPYYERGTFVRGHEFHYWRPEVWNKDSASFAFKVERGFGFDGRRDGIWYKNVLCLYAHIHA
jgi:cobyrinic acid a,c-diamide synthase